MKKHAFFLILGLLISSSVYCATSPDLTVTTAKASPSTIVAGNTTTVSYTLKNQGSATAASSTSAIWLDKNNNGVFDGSPTDTWLVEQSNSSLASGSSKSYSIDVTIPSGISGSKKIMVGCDAASVISESNETNNQYFTSITVTSPLPDLTITTASASPTTIVAGNTTTISYTLKNQGSATAASSTSAIWLDKNNNGVFDGSPTDTWLVEQSNSSLALGSSKSYSIDVTIPSGISGSKKIMVGCDGASSISESNETNNQYFTSITVTSPLPDLTITTASASPTTIFAGNTTTISYTLKNQGSATAASSTSAIWLDKNNNGVFDGSPTDTWLVEQSNSSLASGSSKSYSINVTIPSGISGNMKIMVGCDGASEITESIETNNQFFIPIIITESVNSTIEWSGYIWNVKSGDGVGPGPNNWSSNTSSIWIDSEKNLHLKIRKVGDKWYCSEIYSQKSFGYGEYTFQVSTNVENYDKNVVLGLFTYENDSREIDLEFARWGVSTNPAGWYVVQPSLPESRSNFTLNLAGDYSSHKFLWGPEEIDFQSYHGHYQDIPSVEYLIKDWEYSGTNIPPMGSDKVHLNLWLFQGLALSNNLQEAEVIIKSFKFNPIGDLGVTINNIDNTSSPLPGANGIIQLYNSSNVQIKPVQMTNSSGATTLRNVPTISGNYYKVFHNGGTDYGQEYWGKKDCSTNANQTTSSIFTRNQPYCETLKIFNGDVEVTGQAVDLGTKLRVEQTIKNPSGENQQVQGQVLIDIDKFSPIDHPLSWQTAKTIASGGTITNSWEFSPTIQGDYYFNTGVKTFIDGSFIVTDGWAWSKLPLLKIGDLSGSYIDFQQTLLTRFVVVNDELTIQGTLKDGKGNEIPNCNIGIEDGLKGMCLPGITTGSNGKFSYLSKASRAGMSEICFLLPNGEKQAIYINVYNSILDFSNGISAFSAINILNDTENDWNLEATGDNISYNTKIKKGQQLKVFASEPKRDHFPVSISASTSIININNLFSWSVSTNTEGTFKTSFALGGLLLRGKVYYTSNNDLGICYAPSFSLPIIFTGEVSFCVGTDGINLGTGFSLEGRGVNISMNLYEIPNSIVNQNSNSILYIYPNPVKTVFTIDYSNYNKTAEFVIINSLGQIVYNGLIRDKTDVNINSFQSGIYLLKVQDGPLNVYRKFIKE